MSDDVGVCLARQFPSILRVATPLFFLRYMCDDSVVNMGIGLDVR